MKKFYFIAMVMITMCVACGNAEKTTTTDTPIVNATDIVPAAATEVIPAAAPGPDAGGKVATEVIPDSTNEVVNL